MFELILDYILRKQPDNFFLYCIIFLYFQIFFFKIQAFWIIFPKSIKGKQACVFFLYFILLILIFFSIHFADHITGKPKS